MCARTDCSIIYYFTGLTSGVIAMSGTAVSPGAVDDKSARKAFELAEQQGCPTTAVITMIRCLQNVPADSIIKVGGLGRFDHELLVFFKAVN